MALNACKVMTVADAVVNTTVKVGSAAVGTAIDMTKAGVHAVASRDGDNAKKMKNSRQKIKFFNNST